MHSDGSVRALLVIATLLVRTFVNLSGADKGLQYWWYAAAPGLAIMSVVMGLNFFGDGLRDALDPRRRK